MSKIIVLAEHQHGKVAKATLHAIGAAKVLASIVDADGFDIAVAGYGVDAVAAALTGFGAETIYQLEDPALEHYTAQAYTQAFVRAARAADAEFVVAPATSNGKDCIPRVAARLEAGMASEISDIVDDGGEPLYKRPMWAGNVIGKVKIHTDIHVMSVRVTEFEAAVETGGESDVDKMAAQIDTSVIRMKYIGLEAVESERPALTDANVVVAGGRGLKSAEHFGLIEKLADTLGGAIGASRAVCDAGWVPNDWQVGQTGKVVAPNLYIAVGISGAIQHLAGMKGSKTIVAINKDEEAPIFSVADYGLVADLFDVMPELTEKLQAR